MATLRRPHVFRKLWNFTEVHRLWQGESPMGRNPYTVVDPGPPTIETETDVSFDGVMSVDGFTLYFIQTLPITEKIEYTFEIGYSKQSADFSWSSTDLPGSLSKDDSGFAIGGIFRYKFLKHFAVSGEIEYSTLDFNELIENPLKAAAFEILSSGTVTEPMQTVEAIFASMDSYFAVIDARTEKYLNMSEDKLSANEDTLIEMGVQLRASKKETSDFAQTLVAGNLPITVPSLESDVSTETQQSSSDTLRANIKASISPKF